MQKLTNYGYAAIIVLILVSFVTLYKFFESISRFVEMRARSPINWFVMAAALLILILVIRYILRKKKQLRLADKTRSTPLSSAELVPEWRAWLEQAPLLPFKITSYNSLPMNKLSFDMISSIKFTYGKVDGETVMLHEGKHLFLQLMTIDEALELLFKRKRGRDPQGRFAQEQFGLGQHGYCPAIAKGFYETVRWRIGEDTADGHYNFYRDVTGSIYTLRDRRIAITWKIGAQGSHG